MTGFNWRPSDRSARWVVGNWKMNGDEAMLREIDAVADAATDAANVRIGLAVPHTMIASASRTMTEVIVGAQDVHQANDGAYTGSVSARMVRDAGATFTILGHSERRAAFAEDARMLREKADRASKAGLSILLCCGETAAIRSAGSTADHILDQLAKVVSRRLDPRKLAIAYEPCWAIGGAIAPPVDEVAAVLVTIRRWLRSRFAADEPEVAVLYGGAVDPSFAKSLTQSSSFDGVLIGRASLTAVGMSSIVNQLALASSDTGQAL